MLGEMPEGVKKICIHTGNILSLNEVKKKAGQNPTDELAESLRIALRGEVRPNEDGSELDVFSGEPVYADGENASPGELTTGVKLFVCQRGDDDAIVEAVDKLLPYLEVEAIDSLVLANPCAGGAGRLMPLWRRLESLAAAGKLRRIGVSDVDTDDFVGLYDRAEVKPSIVQINLASCCVVPPNLQEFTKQHDVQLLTHNDPKELLPQSAIDRLLGDGVGGGVTPLSLKWAARFQAHVKCRGVLATKGYLVTLKA